jgi:SAM-dependent methyltransferase
VNAILVPSGDHCGLGEALAFPARPILYLCTTMADEPTIWEAADAYERYIGRWSEQVARAFVEWLALPDDLRWLDVGCGTGALSRAIADAAAPRIVHGIDRSDGFVEGAKQRADPGGVQRFSVGDALDLPVGDATFDVAVSGLVLNFLPDPARAVSELCRSIEVGGTVALYVWDYTDGMQLIRYFWDAANALDPAARALDEGPRFPICQPEALEELFRRSGLQQVGTASIVVPTRFRDVDDYWTPFLGGQGPAPAYAMSLGETERHALRDRLRAALPTSADGSIALSARAFAVRGVAHTR